MTTPIERIDTAIATIQNVIAEIGQPPPVMTNIQAHNAILKLAAAVGNLAQAIKELHPGDLPTDD